MESIVSNNSNCCKNESKNESCVFYRPQLLQALIGLFELPADETVPDDEHFIEIEDTPSYQTAYSQLVFAGKHEQDLFAGSIPDVKVYLAKQLHKLSTQCPGQVRKFIINVHCRRYHCLYLQSPCSQCVRRKLKKGRFHFSCCYFCLL